MPLWLHHKIDKKKEKEEEEVVVLLMEIFRQISTWKYDFDLYKKNLMGKENGPNSPDFELKKFQISPESYENFQKAAKNIEGLCVLLNPSFISSM